jgi:hypothetical protein
MQLYQLATIIISHAAGFAIGGRPQFACKKENCPGGLRPARLTLTRR